jgi:membrane-bound lytic murein transglycosylase D
MRIFAALFLATFFAAAQTPQVPHKMEFAGMTLTIRDDARREIQKDVDALTQSPRHYNIKAERAKTYFPIIEKIFAEEGVPDDFKYLSLQESALIADAVSVSNAVGFWQFKDFTAMEMGLRVDKVVDERLNIVSSTRGAARYIKKNNTFFNNWIYALQAYQMGAGGVLKTVKESHAGETHAEITSKTYWYVKKFLAHKVAYEGGVTGKGQVEVLAYENRSRKSLTDLAREVSVDENELRLYNKWAKSGIIPEDRTYIVMIPITSSTPASVLSAVAEVTKSTDQPGRTSNASVYVKAVKGKINGIPTIQATAGENAAQLAARAKVDLSSFISWNELSSGQSIIPGLPYFLGKKRTRGAEAYHKVSKGETLWFVSQRYGVRLKKLKKYNRLKTDHVAPGTTLWLASMKPKSAKKDMPVEDAVAVEDADTFNWSVTPESDVVTVTSPAETITPQVVVSAPEVAPDMVADTVMVRVDTISIAADTVSIIADTVKSIAIEVPEVKKTEHVVQPKETLYGIAKIYNIGVMDLVNWNGLDLQQGIKPGQILKLSEPEAPKDVVITPKEVFHEVKASDTLFSIARKYGVTIKELMEWNGKKDFSLAVGEKLKVLQAP